MGGGRLARGEGERALERMRGGEKKNSILKQIEDFHIKYWNDRDAR